MLMGGAGEGPGQVQSSTCGLESGGIQRLRFRMQEWEGLCWTRAKNRCLHGGGEGGMGVKEWVSGPPLGAGHCAQGSLAGKLLLVMKIGQ